MARHRMTSAGPVPFTPEEEAEWDAQESAHAAQADERAWNDVRAERNTRLAASDWWVAKAAETGAVLAEDRHAYRQALRDITLQDDPFNIVWPTPPAA